MGRGLASFEVEVVFVENGKAPQGRKGSFSAQLPVVDVPSTYVAWSIYAGDHVLASPLLGRWFQPHEQGAHLAQR